MLHPVIQEHGCMLHPVIQEHECMLQPVLQAHRHWHTGAQVQSEALQPVVQEYETMIYNYIIYRHMLQPAVHALGLVRKQEEERRLPPLPSRPSTPTTWLLFTHLPGPSAHVPCLPSWQHARTPSGPLPLSPAPAPPPLPVDCSMTSCSGTLRAAARALAHARESS